MYNKRCFISIPIFCLIIISLNVKAYKINSTWIDGQKYVYLNDVASFYGMKLTRYKKYCTLSSKYSNIMFNYNSVLSSINGVTVYLSFPIKVKQINKAWIVALSETDFLLLIDPILRKNVLTRQNVKTIVIDPGHGGKDSGTRGLSIIEKDIVLQVAKRLSTILQKMGYKVIFTRNTDVFIELEDRPAFINKCNGDIFISIHCNSGFNKSTIGTETFIYTPQGTASTYGGKALSFQNGNIYNKNNAKLGYEIQKQLTLMNTKDRGMKHAQFKVLKLCLKPAVLIELGFLSSQAEEKNLSIPNYQYLLAYRIAQGIINYSNAVK